MAAPHSQTFPVQMRQPGTVTNTFTVAPRPRSTLEVQVNSPDWLTTDGLTMEFRSRRSSDGGLTWAEAGIPPDQYPGFRDVSPTYAKDGVTHTTPGGVWEWAGTEDRYQVQVRTTQAFRWGMTFTLTDTP